MVFEHNYVLLILSNVMLDDNFCIYQSCECCAEYGILIFQWLVMF